MHGTKKLLGQVAQAFMTPTHAALSRFLLPTPMDSGRVPCKLLTYKVENTSGFVLESSAG